MSVVTGHQSVRSALWEIVSESCFHNNVHQKLDEENQKKLELYLVTLLEKFLVDPKKVFLLYEYLFLSYKDVITTDCVRNRLSQIQALADAALIRAGIFKRTYHTAGDLKLAQAFYQFVYQGKGENNFFSSVYKEFSFNIAPYVLVLLDIRDGYIRQPRISALIEDCQHTFTLNQRAIGLLEKRGINILDYIHADEETIIQ